MIGWRALTPIVEQRPPSRCPPSYARMSFEAHELREGEALSGRAVIYTPQPLDFKRIDLCLAQGIARPEPVGRITLGDPATLGLDDGVLPVGSHPFYLELHAPPETGPVDPFLFEVVLVRGLLRTPREVRSLPMHLFLLERRYAPSTRVEHAAEGLRAPIRAAARERERSHVEAPASFEPALASPSRPVDEGERWTELAVVSSSGVFGPERPAGHIVSGRFCPATATDGGLSVELPDRLDEPALPLRIRGGGRLVSMSVAIHYELVRPDGEEVSAAGFPGMEQVRVLGRGALDAARYGPDGVELLVRVPPSRLEAVTRARRDGAHDASLRLRIGLDAIDRADRVVPCPTRAIRYTGPLPDGGSA